MDQNFAAAKMKTIGEDRTSCFGFLELDGVPLDETEIRAPRRDFGPIGSGSRRAKDLDMKGVEPLLYSWTSDFIKEGGQLADESLRGSGLVVGLRTGEQVMSALSAEMKMGFAKRNEPPPNWNPFENGPNSLMRQNKVPARRTPEGSNDPWYPYANANRRLSDQSEDSSSGYGSSFGSSLSLNSIDAHRSPEDGPKIFSSTKKDVTEFAKQYGHVGSVRPQYQLKHKKGNGKYFIKFNP